MVSRPTRCCRTRRAGSGRHGAPCRRFCSSLEAGRRRPPLRRTGLPALLALGDPELEGFFPAQLPAPFEQRWLPIGHHFPEGHLHRLVTAIPEGGPEVQHLAAVADPRLLGRQRRPVPLGTAQATSGDQPRWRCKSSVQPLQRWVRCSPSAISPWCRWQVNRGMCGPGPPPGPAPAGGDCGSDRQRGHGGANQRRGPGPASRTAADGQAGRQSAIAGRRRCAPGARRVTATSGDDDDRAMGQRRWRQESGRRRGSGRGHCSRGQAYGL